MTDIAFRPAHALAAAIRRRELSSRELLDHYLARVERLNPPLNAVVTLDVDARAPRRRRGRRGAARGDGARPAARPADDDQGHLRDRGPAHDLRARGMATTCRTRDADAVARLRDAGAVIFGKTNTPTLAGDGQTYNPIFGVTNNPWDTARTPGGSSGGAAAAVAAGLTGARARQRHRRLDPHAVELVRRLRPQADVRHRPAARPHPAAAGHARRVRPRRDGPARAAASTTSSSRSTCWPARHGHGAPAGAWRSRAARATTLRDLRHRGLARRPGLSGRPRGAARARRRRSRRCARPAPARRDRRPAVDLPDVVRTYQQLLYPILLGTMAQESFDGFVALAAQLPPKDDAPLARSGALRDAAPPRLAVRPRAPRAAPRADGGLLPRRRRAPDAGRRGAPRSRTTTASRSPTA